MWFCFCCGALPRDGASSRQLALLLKVRGASAMFFQFREGRKGAPWGERMVLAKSRVHGGGAFRQHPLWMDARVGDAVDFEGPAGACASSPRGNTKFYPCVVVGLMASPT